MGFSRRKFLRGAGAAVASLPFTSACATLPSGTGSAQPSQTAEIGLEEKIENMLAVYPEDPNRPCAGKFAGGGRLNLVRQINSTTRRLTNTHRPNVLNITAETYRRRLRGEDVGPIGVLRQEIEMAYGGKSVILMNTKVDCPPGRIWYYLNLLEVAKENPNIQFLIAAPYPDSSGRNFHESLLVAYPTHPFRPYIEFAMNFPSFEIFSKNGEHLTKGIIPPYQFGSVMELLGSWEKGDHSILQKHIAETENQRKKYEKSNEELATWGLYHELMRRHDFTVHTMPVVSVHENGAGTTLIRDEVPLLPLMRGVGVFDYNSLQESGTTNLELFQLIEERTGVPNPYRDDLVTVGLIQSRRRNEIKEGTTVERILAEFEDSYSKSIDSIERAFNPSESTAKSSIDIQMIKACMEMVKKYKSDVQARGKGEIKLPQIYFLTGLWLDGEDRHSAKVMENYSDFCNLIERKTGIRFRGYEAMGKFPVRLSSGEGALSSLRYNLLDWKFAIKNEPHPTYGKSPVVYIQERRA